MSKIIRMTPELREEAIKEFSKALEVGKLADGKISFSKTLGSTDEKALVWMTPDAYIKMWALLQSFNKEVAWHGVAYRYGEEGSHEYLITDILVYPQEVAATTVEMDTEKYALWLMENDEDERFANIHMQGHSHVNMSTTPSGVDLTHQEEILHQLGDDDFYIFMIYNKSMKSTYKIYDMRKNIMFEDKDIAVRVLGAQEGLDEFLENAKAMVKDKVYNFNRNTTPATTTTPAKPTTPAPASSPPSSVSKPYNPLGSTTPATPANPTTPATPAPTDKPKTQIGNGWGGKKNACEQTSMYDGYDYDDPYGAYGCWER